MLVDSESSLTFKKKVETVIDSPSSHVAREEHAELKVSVKSMERLISSVAGPISYLTSFMIIIMIISI